MPKIILSFLLLISLKLFSQSNASFPVKQIEQIRQHYAPDKRTAWFEVKAIRQGNGWLLRGETTVLAARDSLLTIFKKMKVKVIDSIKVWPADAPGWRPFGVVTVSPCNIRSAPGHSQELATQALLGTPLNVLKQQENWFLVQTPDKYIGWLEEGAFKAFSRVEMEEWKALPKVIFTGLSGTVLAGIDTKSGFLGDVNAGDVLAFRGEHSNLVEVGYADGRKGFLYKVQVIPLRTWLESRQVTTENILNTARDLLGRPYLWGGTSPKGMDCSGFTKTVFFLNGVILARDASQQVRSGLLITATIDWKVIKPGDFLFFGKAATPSAGEKVTHVAIYLGEGKIIHSGDGQVQIQSLRPGDADFVQKRYDTFLRAKRMLPFSPEKETAWIQDVYR